jgi:hypothetical protein
MSSFPKARGPLYRARKEFISQSLTISGWTPSFPQTWVAPRAPIASIPKAQTLHSRSCGPSTVLDRPRQ